MLSAALAMFLCGGDRAAAQNGADEWKEIPGVKLIDPRSYGFRANPDYVTTPDDLRVLVEVDQEVVVAIVHAVVGDSYILLMPDGQLIDRKSTEVQVTDRPFEAIDMDELAKRLRVGALSQFKVLKSRNYLFIYNTSENYVQVTKRILESMLKGLMSYMRRMDCEPHEPLVPQVVIMFRTEREFQQFREMPAHVLAYYHVVSNQIVLHEEPPLAATRPDLAFGQALSTIAHEGTHQILHNTGIQKRLAVWPMWLSEGLAEYLAPTSFGTNFRWKGAGEINDLRMLELEQYIQSRSFKGLDGSTLLQTVEAQQLDSTGYAAAWSTLHFLAKRREREFKQYLQLISRMEPLQGMAARPGEPVVENVEHFQHYFGEDFADLEQELVNHLQKQPYNSPVALYPHFVALIEYPDGRKSVRRGGFFYEQKQAADWLNEFLAYLAVDQRNGAQYRIEEYQNRAAASKRIVEWAN